MLQLLVDCLQIIKENANLKRILFIQEKSVSTGFAKSLFLEQRGLEIKVITVSPELLTIEILSNEILDTKSFSEIIYKDGKRLIPELSMISSKSERNILPTYQDVVLVTGGAKGIGLECIRRIGIETKCKLILVGRSDENADGNVASNLSILKKAGR